MGFTLSFQNCPKARRPQFCLLVVDVAIVSFAVEGKNYYMTYLFQVLKHIP